MGGMRGEERRGEGTYRPALPPVTMAMNPARSGSCEGFQGVDLAMSFARWGVLRLNCDERRINMSRKQSRQS